MQDTTEQLNLRETEVGSCANQLLPLPCKCFDKKTFKKRYLMVGCPVLQAAITEETPFGTYDELLLRNTFSPPR